MTMKAVVRFVLALAPPWWRHRYGPETAELTEELLEEPGAHRLRLLASLLAGSMLAWLQVRRFGDYLRPLSSPNQWGAIPEGSHRDIFGNRGLWPRSEAALEPGESLLGVIDGVVGNRSVANLPMMGVCFTLAALVMPLLFHGHVVLWSLGEGVLLLAVGLVLRPLTTSYNISLAVTSSGVVLFHRGYTGRTGKMIGRMPANEPELLKVGAMARKIRLGDRTLWMTGKSDPMLYWMSATWRAANPQ